MLTKWRRLLREARSEVSRCNPSPYYLETYRRDEKSFWSHIPKWISQDNSNKQIRACLDVGCAYGTLAVFVKTLTNCQTYCVDFVEGYLSPSLIARHGLIFAINNIETDPFPWPIPFDAIVFTEVLEHLNFHPVPTLRKLHDLLSSEGRLYLSTPDASEWGKVTKYYSSLADMPEPTIGRPIVDDHVYQYSEEELRATLAEAGFTIDRFAYSPGAGRRHFNLTATRS